MATSTPALATSTTSNSATATTSGADGARSLLRQLFPTSLIRETLLSREDWRPFPRCAERAGWQQLPDDVRSRTVAQAEPHLGKSWPELPATLFLEYRRNGNRSRYEAHHFARRTSLAQLVLGECVEGKGRFLDDIVNGVWALCEESFWGVPAHNARHSPLFPGSGLPDTSLHEVDLFAAETGALLAWTHYLVGKQLAAELPVVTDRIVREVEARILTPYRTLDDWRWLGHTHRPVNNWNPWIHSNILAANLLLEADAARRRDTVLRIVKWLDVFLDGYHDDGGCDEGPSYWGRGGASLFDCLELLHSASAGRLDVYGAPLVQEIGRYIYRAHVAGPWYVNFADASAKPSPSGNLVYRYGKRIGDPRMMAHGAYVAQQSLGEVDARGRASLARALPAIFSEDEVRRAAGAPPLVREAWLDGIQMLAAREWEGSADGLFLAAKGGHNAESHNHNDVGQFIVALDGHPLLIDVGVETYTRKTFGEQRYDIWTMQSLYHNLPAIDGQGQRPGRAFNAGDVAAEVTPERAALRLDLADAYPAELGIRRWQREVRLERGTGPSSAAHAPDTGRIVLDESWELDRAPQSLALHLMTSGAVDSSRPGTLACASPTRPLLVRYDPQMFTHRVEEIAVKDARLQPVWGDRVYRVVLGARQPVAAGSWSITIEAGE
ncbi:MAG: hypothetical protein AVDCRST_MAG77-4142 [uncultured Chloroflexi bacterium]|uniref:Heparinase II/III-like C-terminal domain-containing protein n=1 Tax=uncultured Chloroflexota bacterium TaxID=166587 RepID=A0A6J4JPR6_9CHLR|nr:MAG: hypothetical protein AVDCRST_MAG77-4142 [uncultured Chloroflexota bacterium]